MASATAPASQADGDASGVVMVTSSLGSITLETLGNAPDLLAAATPRYAIALPTRLCRRSAALPACPPCRAPVGPARRRESKRALLLTAPNAPLWAALRCPDASPLCSGRRASAQSKSQTCPQQRAAVAASLGDKPRAHGSGGMASRGGEGQGGGDQAGAEVSADCGA